MELFSQRVRARSDCRWWNHHTKPVRHLEIVEGRSANTFLGYSRWLTAASVDRFETGSGLPRIGAVVIQWRESTMNWCVAAWSGRLSFSVDVRGSKERGTDCFKTPGAMLDMQLLRNPSHRFRIGNEHEGRINSIRKIADAEAVNTRRHDRLSVVRNTFA